MEKLKMTSQIVLKLLIEDKQARKDDSYLRERVYEYLIPNVTTKSEREINELIRRGILPCPESIRRSRQIKQRKYPELQDKDTVKRRAKKEPEYRKLARS